MTPDVRCMFTLRTPVPGGHRYDPFSIAGPSGMSSALRTPQPPVVGDLIFLSDQSNRDLAGLYVVVARQWSHSQYGSMNWPYGSEHSQQPPTLDVIVEPSEGLYADEISTPEEDA